MDKWEVRRIYIAFLLQHVHSLCHSPIHAHFHPLMAAAAMQGASCITSGFNVLLKDTVKAGGLIRRPLIAECPALPTAPTTQPAVTPIFFLAEKKKKQT